MLGTQLGAASTGIVQQLPVGVYLPLVFQGPASTATPEPTSTPEPTTTPAPPTAVPTNPPAPTQPPVSGACATNAPAPAEGAQAWMVNDAPVSRSNDTVCVRLIVNGQPAAGASVTAVLNYKSTKTTLTGSTDASGVAALAFYNGSATKGYEVIVDVSIEYSDATYVTTTQFTPQ